MTALTRITEHPPSSVEHQVDEAADLLPPPDLDHRSLGVFVEVISRLQALVVTKYFG